MSRSFKSPPSIWGKAQGGEPHHVLNVSLLFAVVCCLLLAVAVVCRLLFDNDKMDNRNNDKALTTLTMTINTMTMTNDNDNQIRGNNQ